MMDSDVKEIRSFLVRKLHAAQRTMKKERAYPDPYRRGFIDGLAMVQSYIDKVIINKEKIDHEK